MSTASRAKRRTRASATEEALMRSRIGRGPLRAPRPRHTIERGGLRLHGGRTDHNRDEACCTPKSIHALDSRTSPVHVRREANPQIENALEHRELGLSADGP